MNMLTRRTFIQLSAVATGGFGAQFLRAAEPFSIVVLPDTQMYNAKPQPNLFGHQTNWIAQNIDAEQIVFVTQLGDFTDDGRDDTFWKNALTGIRVLDNKVPYSICFGNHDLFTGAPDGKGVPNCRKYCTAKSLQGGDTCGGASPDGLSFYQVFKGGKFSFLHVNLVFSPDAKTLAWAKNVVQANAEKPAIISTHDYLGMGGVKSAAGRAIWNGLVKDSPSVLMVLNGHHCSIAKQMSLNASGGKVVEMLANYQDFPDGGEAYLRIIKFVPDKGSIHVKTYSPSRKQFIHNIDNEFSFDAEFNSDENSIDILGLHGFSHDYELPYIDNQSGEQVFSASRPATYSVKAGGTGPLSYQWMRCTDRALWTTYGGIPVKNATQASFSTHEKPTPGDPDPSFFVRVSNKAGSVVSDRAVLKAEKP